MPRWCWSHRLGGKPTATTVWKPRAQQAVNLTSSGRRSRQLPGAMPAGWRQPWRRWSESMLLIVAGGQEHDCAPASAVGQLQRALLELSRMAPHSAGMPGGWQRTRRRCLLGPVHEAGRSQGRQAQRCGHGERWPRRHELAEHLSQVQRGERQSVGPEVRHLRRQQTDDCPESGPH